ncbi:MAG: acetate/propionate family kinase [Betaproteobacteria bacterium]
MTRAAAARILAVNTGSSSLKSALYRANAPDTAAFNVVVDRIGGMNARLRVTDGQGKALSESSVDAPDFDAALDSTLRVLEQFDPGHRLAGVGHRLVHGGLLFDRPQLITQAAMAALDDIARLAPEHMPQALVAVRFIAKRHPDVPQIACFDTAFHRAMPRVAQTIALPQRWRDEGFVRFGFHGLSYESAVSELRRVDPAGARGRTIVAHLGNGASMAAIRDGVAVDTTMGYTPTSGLVMGTRCGDIDPGVLIELSARHAVGPDQMNVLLNKQSGLLGVSGISQDMRDLLAAEPNDSRAADAIELFCYRVRKYLGAFASVLGGIDTLIFTGGIGEKSATIRERICAGQTFLDIVLDPAANQANAPVISTAGATVTIRVIRADEEGVIVRHALALLGAVDSPAPEPAPID